MSNPTAAESRYMARVAALPCVACNASPPSLAHHIREGVGMGQRSSNYLVVSLCPECHVGEFSIHMTRRQFQDVYGSELRMLAETIEKLSKGVG